MVQRNHKVIIESQRGNSLCHTLPHICLITFVIQLIHIYGKFSFPIISLYMNINDFIVQIKNEEK